MSTAESTSTAAQTEQPPMNTERRYTDDEVSEILDRATEAQTDRSLTSAGAAGLTLGELHEIGREVGIPEEVITVRTPGFSPPKRGCGPRPSGSSPQAA